MGLANRVVPSGKALEEATALAQEIARKPQAALRSDRRSSYEQWSMTLDEALANEYRHGMATLETGEACSAGWRTTSREAGARRGRSDDAHPPVVGVQAEGVPPGRVLACPLDESRRVRGQDVRLRKWDAVDRREHDGRRHRHEGHVGGAKAFAAEAGAAIG